MAQDTVSIIRIETGEAVKSVNDLKENIKILKEDLGKLDIGSTEYQDTLVKLKENQAALKDAMYATSSSMEEVAANAKGINVVFDEHNKLINQENQSYNALVNTMAELKTRWRATADEAERAELGERIKQINDTLKDMDASVGNFSRNVGDYTNAVKKALGDFPNFADPAKKAIKGVNDTMSLMSQNPLMGTIALITPLVMKLTDAIKENEDSMGAIKNLMNAMRPVMDFFQGVLKDVVEFIAKIIANVAEFLGNSGIFNKVVNGIAGIGNAIVQFVISPFKAVIEAIKVFKEQGIKGFRDAGKAFLGEMKNGISFKQNFETGEIIADTIMSGVKSKKEDVKKTGYDFAMMLKEGYDEAWDEIASDEDSYKMLHREIEAQRKAREEAKKERIAQEKAMHSEIVKMNEEEAKRNKEIWDKEKKDAEELAKAKIATLYQVADATASIFSSLADLYESNDKENEKSAKKAKALRIAQTTLDTISGAVAAFMSVWKSELPLTAKAITAPLMSASVVAAGMAQIAKMKSTNISSSASVSAIASAPSTSVEIPQMRSVTSASEEDRLNQMASDQRVVLVMSDLEAKQGQRRVQMTESSF